MWSEEEKASFRRAWTSPGVATFEDGTVAVANRAAELLAARGGTMTAEELAGALHDVRTAVGPHHADGIAAHISTLGARLAVLARERDEWRVKWEGATQNEEMALELAATREQERDAALSEMERLKAELAFEKGMVASAEAEVRRLKDADASGPTGERP